MKKFNIKSFKNISSETNRFDGRSKFRVINIVNIFLAIAFLLTLGVKFYYSDKASIAGINLGQYENEIITYQQQNEFLRNKYLTMTSLSVVKPLALENGYVEANVEYYTSPELAVR